MKRFWKAATVEEAEGGFTVALDTRPVRTPAKRPSTVPSRALAEAIAAEWDAQGEEVSPLNMPLTRAVATALDRVMPEMAAVAEQLTAYGGTDLLCYRAPFPPGLIARQSAGWDPWLAWAERELGARLTLAEGVMHVAQDDSAMQAFARAVGSEDGWGLTVLHEFVTLSGSLVLGLAVLRGALAPETAWDLSRIDEQWNIDEWGEDAEAARLAAAKRSDFLQAARFLDLVRTAP